MEKLGIDVHKVATQVCILTERGEYEEQRIRTERDALTTFSGGRPRARGRYRERVGRSPPRVARARGDRRRPRLRAHVRKAAGARSKPTSETRALCDACHLGAFRRAHRASDLSRLLRKHLAARELLVQTRSLTIFLCRSLLHQEGINAFRNWGRRFSEALQAHHREGCGSGTPEAGCCSGGSCRTLVGVKVRPTADVPRRS
jgi:transposase